MHLVHYTNRRVTNVVSVAQRTDDDPFISRYRFGAKPQGLWVSDDDDPQNWRTWCIDEEYNIDHLTHIHDVQLAVDANVLVLSSIQHLDDFTLRFGHTLPDDFLDRYPSYQRGSVSNIRWTDVAAAYSGIIITPYQWARRFHMPTQWYYAWDCASGCIWDAHAIASITLRHT